jgi:hypothetical protein
MGLSAIGVAVNLVMDGVFLRWDGLSVVRMTPRRLVNHGSSAQFNGESGKQVPPPETPGPRNPMRGPGPRFAVAAPSSGKKGEREHPFVA